MAITIGFAMKDEGLKQGLADIKEATKDVGIAADVASQQAVTGLEAEQAKLQELQQQLNQVVAAQREVGGAASEAGQSGAKGIGELDNAARATSSTMDSLKRSAAGAAKEMAEGALRATETFLRTGDAKEAALDFAEGAAKAAGAFHPVVGMAAQAAVSMAKVAKASWDAAEAAKAEAEARKKAQEAAEAQSKAAESVRGTTQYVTDLQMGYEDLTKKTEEYQKRLDAIDAAYAQLHIDQQNTVRGSEEWNAIGEQAKKLLEEQAQLQKELSITEDARAKSKAKYDADEKAAAENRRKEYEAEADKIETDAARRFELEKKDENELYQLIVKKREALKAANGDEKESQKIISEIAELQARRVELINERIAKQKREDEQFNKSQEEQRKRNEEAQKEAERIHNMDIKAAEEEKETRADLERIIRESRDALSDQTLTQEKQNELLKEMERAKRKMMDMDRQAAEDQKRAAQEAAQRQADARTEADERKRRWAETAEGRIASAQAADPTAVRDRIAKETGRKRGTVEGMMRRGEISEAEINIAAQKNFDEIYAKSGGASAGGSGKLSATMNRQNDATGSVMRRQDAMEQWLAEVDARTKAMYEAARYREQETRRRRGGR